MIFLFITFLSLFCCQPEKKSPVESILRFENNGVTLEGVLNLPDKKGKYPLAVFVHGSGMATRHDYSEFVRPFLEADIAIFRYDKRGVGASGGNYANIGPYNSEEMFSLLASDCAAAISELGKNENIDVRKIIVIGGSQAGWIIPEVNTKTDLWLTICFSGPSVTVGEEIYYSDLAEHGAYTLEQADEMLRDFNGTDGFDPLPRIAKLKKPSLWLFGGRDVSIPVKRSIQLIDSVKAVQQLPLDIELYPQADHGLFNRQLGEREDFIPVIIRWIQKQH